jgi:hypothetical protein
MCHCSVIVTSVSEQLVITIFVVEEEMAHIYQPTGCHIHEDCKLIIHCHENVTEHASYSTSCLCFSIFLLCE